MRRQAIKPETRFVQLSPERLAQLEEISTKTEPDNITFYCQRCKIGQAVEAEHYTNGHFKVCNSCWHAEQEATKTTHLCECTACGQKNRFFHYTEIQNDHHCHHCKRLNWESMAIEFRRNFPSIQHVIGDTFAYDRARQGLKKTPREFGPKLKAPGISKTKSFYDFERESWIEKYKAEGKGTPVFVSDLLSSRMSYSMNSRKAVTLDAELQFSVSPRTEGAEWTDTNPDHDSYGLLAYTQSRLQALHDLQIIAPGSLAYDLIADEVYGEHVRGHQSAPVTRTNFTPCATMAAGE